MKEVLMIFQSYTGSGFLTILYLLAMLYLWISEKNSTVRAIFVYGASVIQLLFFSPLFFWGYQLLDEGTYYRILWILPMTATIAYAMVKLLAKYPKAGTGLGIIMIIMCGKYVYSNEYISTAQNAYHIPQEVIEVCDIIMPEELDERITGVFPDDLIHFVRQYTSRIQMAYGRDYLAPDWIYGDHPLREVMNQEEIRCSLLIKLATEYKCHYIIIGKDKKMIGDLKKANVVRIGETKNYDIYRNYQVDIEKVK